MNISSYNGLENFAFFFIIGMEYTPAGIFIQSVAKAYCTEFLFYFILAPFFDVGFCGKALTQTTWALVCIGSFFR